jgi:hypothetical protein
MSVTRGARKVRDMSKNIRISPLLDFVKVPSSDGPRSVLSGLPAGVYQYIRRLSARKVASRFQREVIS